MTAVLVLISVLLLAGFGAGLTGRQTSRRRANVRLQRQRIAHEQRQVELRLQAVTRETIERMLQATKPGSPL